MKSRIHCAHKLSEAIQVSLRQPILRPQLPSSLPFLYTRPLQPVSLRSFTTTPQPSNWLMPKKGHTDRGRKGRCRVPTGGSTRGTTLAWGDYGVRLRDYDQKISAKHLEIAMATLKVCLRGERYRVYTRVAANTGVYKSGNQVRMGKGKGKFDHWTARVAVSQIVFEVSGTMHEEVARNAMRIVGNKLPGLYEFVKKGDPPMMGLTPLHPGVTLETLRKPIRSLPRYTARHIPLTTPDSLTNLPPPPSPTAATPSTPP